MNALRIAALVAAALTSGLIGGVFYAYAISVMPALNRADDRTIVDVMQKINVVIINPWFMIGFMGTLGFSVLAAALHLGKDHRATLVWIAVAVVLNLVAFAVTSGLNVPLNDQLAAAGDPAQIQNLAQVRADFESSWVRWNIVRAVLHTLAFLVLAGALYVAGVQSGRNQVAAAPTAAVPGQFSAPQGGQYPQNPPTRPFSAQQNSGQYGPA
ncbi:anthrone oxygenase family protein [Nocardia sp. NPDC048505]|uniref:anthrone oxygenase family protein n=1 Tax=unclassified Nocardia TaxID=2637762 RepID=UPI0033DDD67D